MNKAEILGLADRCEKLEGGNTTVDEMTLLASGWKLERAEGLGRRATWIDPGGCRTSRRQGDGWFRPTTSIDAAMGLVPEGFSWAAGWTADAGHATVSIMPEDDEAYSGGRLPAPDIQTSGYAFSAAAALTAAALRAIASTMEDDRG